MTTMEELEFNLSVRASNMLRKAGIKTIEELLNKTPKQLLTTHNFGKKSLKEILEVLTEKGLSLKQENLSSFTDEKTDPLKKTKMVEITYWECNFPGHEHRSRETAIKCMERREVHKPRKDNTARNRRIILDVLDGHTKAAVARKNGLAAESVDSILRRQIRRLRHWISIQGGDYSFIGHDTKTIHAHKEKIKTLLIAMWDKDH